MNGDDKIAGAPLVDVLIPVYNAEGTVTEAIDSILSQTVADLRVIVIDDGSTDATPDRLRALAARDARVRVYRKPNGGIVDALNFGLQFCEADYVARHDADDLADPDRLEAQIDYLTRHPDCVAVSSFARHIDQFGAPTGSIALFTRVAVADMAYVPSREPYLLHPFLMVRRRALQSVGGYRYAHHAEDVDLYWRLLEVGRLHNIEVVMGSYRFTPSSITSRSVVNGRISAIHSQLAAISAARRARGEPDLTFTPETLAPMAAAQSSAGIFAIASRQLSETESEYLKRAYAAKIMELTSYRPYDLDAEDCDFIKGALAGAWPEIPAKNRSQLRRTLAVTVARKLVKGDLADAMTLMRVDIAPQAAARSIFQLVERILPDSVRRRVEATKSKRVKLDG